MLVEIFKSVLLMSLAGSILSLLLLIAKPLTGKMFSPGWQYYIWLAVLVVMLLPVSFSLPQKAPDPPPVTQTLNDAPRMVSEEKQPEAAVNALPEQSPIQTLDIPQNFLSCCSLIWIFGTLLMLMIKTTRYILFLKTIHKCAVEDCFIPNIPKRLRVRKTAMLDAPLLVGLFRPILYLPVLQLSETDLNYILMHELTHYKRMDLLYKWAVMIVGSVHWFNPFVYIMSKQIDLECEVSCDFAVTGSLSEQEQNNYMNMILNLLGVSRNSPRLLTTQMASNKKILRRRFTVIKTKKATGKIMSIVSVIIAIAMLSTSVFASGVLSGLTQERYMIEIRNNDGEKMELNNKPFIENGEVYVPLRELFEKLGYNETNSMIRWDDGRIDIAVLNDSGENGLYRLSIGEADFALKHFQGRDLYSANMDDAAEIHMLTRLGGAPVLKGSTTYVPLQNLNYILYGFLDKRIDQTLCELTYTVYDQNGTEIKEVEGASDGTQSTKIFEDLTKQLFSYFAIGDFENMKKLCTPQCVEGFFRDDFVFGMEKAKLINIDAINGGIDDNEYINWSATVRAEVELSPQSVWDEDTKEAMFYVLFEKQNDGSYLINEFATGL